MSNGTVIKDLLSVKFELPVWVKVDWDRTDDWGHLRACR